MTAQTRFPLKSVPHSPKVSALKLSRVGETFSVAQEKRVTFANDPDLDAEAIAQTHLRDFPHSSALQIIQSNCLMSNEKKRPNRRRSQ